MSNQQQQQQPVQTESQKYVAEFIPIYLKMCAHFKQMVPAMYVTVNTDVLTTFEKMAETNPVIRTQFKGTEEEILRVLWSSFIGFILNMHLHEEAFLKLLIQFADESVAFKQKLIAEPEINKKRNEFAHLCRNKIRQFKQESLDGIDPALDPKLVAEMKQHIERREEMALDTLETFVKSPPDFDLLIRYLAVFSNAFRASPQPAPEVHNLAIK